MRQASLQELYEEAKLYDIPLVLGARKFLECSDHSNENAHNSYTYQALLPRNEITLFYTQEMEEYGWDMLTQMRSSHETVLAFEKPYKFAFIAIREAQDTQPCQVHIFVGPKD